MTNIKKLSDTTINRIAAGEVIERPASVIKELIENALDAGATEINVTIEAAGKNLIIISDNGKGMSEEDLELAVQRHTTSKLNESDIMNITSFGFRGEALPSIASISKLAITSKTIDTNHGYQITINGGARVEGKPVAHNNPGTKIEVKDLFFATPARLKFLKNDKTELAICLDVIKKIALAHPHISFTFISEGKLLLKAPQEEQIKARLNSILGQNFIENAAPVDFNKEHFGISGYVSIPTYNRSTSNDQYLYVNNRLVKDKLTSIAARIAYQDYLAKDRHPVMVIFINTLPQLVDVNVHPAKAEVRFRDSNDVREMLISAIKSALHNSSQQTSTQLGQNLINKVQSSVIPSKDIIQQVNNPTLQYKVKNDTSYSSVLNPDRSLDTHVNDKQHSYRPLSNAHSKDNITSHQTRVLSAEQPYLVHTLPNVYTEGNISADLNKEYTNSSLGAACTQIHETYIVAQVEDGIVIVDQHAAHERLTYEAIKQSLVDMKIPAQRLIIPVIVELPDEHRAQLLASYAETLHKFGLSFKKYSQRTIVVNEIPLLLGEFDVNKLIQDLADDIRDLGEHVALQELIEQVTETYACHYSIRAGRKMSIAEMNELLRKMETTPFSGQCNHGRPTYIKLQLHDIEKLFGRK